MAQKGEGKLVYMLRRGGHESIVFLHGLGASKGFFKLCFELDSFRDYTLAAPDLPGCGESRWFDASSCTMEDQAGIVLKWIRNYKSAMIDVTDEEILSARKSLSEYEGIFALPASAAAFAGLLKFNSQKKIDPNKQVILIITGSGLKSMKKLSSGKTKLSSSTLNKLDSLFKVKFNS